MKVTPCQPQQFVAFLCFCPWIASKSRCRCLTQGSTLGTWVKMAWIPAASFPSALAFLKVSCTSRKTAGVNLLGEFMLSVYVQLQIGPPVLLLRTVCWLRCNPPLCLFYQWAMTHPVDQGTAWSLKMPTSPTWQLCVPWTTSLGSGILMLK